MNIVNDIFYCFGSKSSTGVDWFVVDTEPGCAVRIHKAVDYWAKHIVEQVKNTSGGTGEVSIQYKFTYYVMYHYVDITYHDCVVVLILSEWHKGMRCCALTMCTI